MHQRIAELAALMDRALRFRRRVARNTAGEGELAKQLSQAIRITRHVRIDFRVGAFEIGVGDHAGAAMAGAADIDDVEIESADRAIEVGIDEVEPRRGSPMPEQPRLGVVGLEPLFEQRIVEEIDLANGEIIGGAPVAVEQFQIVGACLLAWCCHQLHADLLGRCKQRPPSPPIRSVASN